MKASISSVSAFEGYEVEVEMLRLESALSVGKVCGMARSENE
jgi:hypothetical protein